MIIGGAEDKMRKPTILKHFVARSGGADARIAVIPTASAPSQFSRRSSTNRHASGAAATRSAARR